MLNPFRFLSTARALSVIAYELRAIRKLAEQYLTASGIPLPLTTSQQRDADRAKLPPAGLPDEETLAEQRAVEIMAARARGETVEGPGNDWDVML